MPETEIISEKEMDALVVLARGNVDLVGEALISNIKKEGFWFWQKWIIDKTAAINYIKERTEKLENIPMLGDDELY